MDVVPVAWNKGLAVGQKRPLTIYEIRAIHKYLIDTSCLRNTALFCLAIDSMLRCIDLLNIKVRDISDSYGQVADSFTVIQQKTRKPVAVKLERSTQNSLQQWIEYEDKSLDDFIFTGLTRTTKGMSISASHYRILVKQWVRHIGLDPKNYSTHSLRRTKATLIYQATKDPEVVRILLGHTSLTNTAVYLGIDTNHAFEVASQIKLFDHPESSAHHKPS